MKLRCFLIVCNTLLDIILIMTRYDNVGNYVFYVV